MAGGYRVDPQVLHDVAGILRTAAHDLDTVAPPPAPQAGLVTGAVAGVMAHLAEQTFALTAKLAGAADAVTTGRDDYQLAEDNARNALPKPGPKPV
ncbi:hypothetical protein SAMN05421810_106128 [Amycolatopsis arida]|uniref:Excreted virulence factor EspC, type VII ESX diderm n=1 Tax=Amycolatopsis arida TaxID=587909 RepID=A0A1I5XKU9_9PSEU|nr:hypothetical protein [Amycolatopsis arida]TDX97390.1 hypothetical protein CLV69_102493 [Amycolatopsis arida]SFQ32436.1 hypothetical protein SAMN05421810_106128 [Amycolatopsis arida]